MVSVYSLEFILFCIRMFVGCDKEREKFYIKIEVVCFNEYFHKKYLFYEYLWVSHRCIEYVAASK